MDELQKGKSIKIIEKNNHLPLIQVAERFVRVKGNACAASASASRRTAAVIRVVSAKNAPYVADSLIFFLFSLFNSYDFVYLDVPEQVSRIRALHPVPSVRIGTAVQRGMQQLFLCSSGGGRSQRLETKTAAS